MYIYPVSHVTVERRTFFFRGGGMERKCVGGGGRGGEKECGGGVKRRCVCVGGCTQFVRGRIRMTIYIPSHSYYAGTEHVGFCTNQADIPCTKREASCGVRRVPSIRVNCILPRTARKTDSGTLPLLSCLWMTAPISCFFFGGHSRQSNIDYFESASWVLYHIHTSW